MFKTGDTVTVTVTPEDHVGAKPASAFKCPFARAASRAFAVKFESEGWEFFPEDSVGVCSEDTTVYLPNYGGATEWSHPGSLSHAIMQYDLHGMPIPSGDYTLTCEYVPE